MVIIVHLIIKREEFSIYLVNQSKRDISIRLSIVIYPNLYIIR